MAPPLLQPSTIGTTVSSHSDPASAQDAGTRSTLRRKRLKALTLLLGIVAVAVASYLVGSRTRTENQAAARAAAVPRTTLTTPVRVQQLTSTLVFRANVAPAATTSLSVRPTASDNEDPVVTDVFIEAGKRVRAGKPLIAIAGRPVIALAGVLPSYRDLQVGDEGPDVKQLQNALIQLNYNADGADGTYGVETASAVAQLWQDAGFKAPTVAVATNARSGSKRSITAAMVVKGSIAFLPRLPVVISSVLARRGQLLASDKPWASVQSGGSSSRLTASIPQSSAPQVAVGANVKLFDDATGEEATAKITSLGTVTRSADDSGLTVPAQLQIDGTSPFAAGIDLRAVATTKSTSRSVLSVPVAAVHSANDGSTFVLRRDRGTDVTVLVTTGQAAQGYVAIVKSSPALQAGQSVVVSD